MGCFGRFDCDRRGWGCGGWWGGGCGCDGWDGGCGRRRRWWW
jgi:hypothetical protein